MDILKIAAVRHTKGRNELGGHDFDASWLGGVLDWGAEMISAPSLEGVRKELAENPARIIGFLFAPPFTKTGAQDVIPRIGYLDARTGKSIHFFCAGYGGYNFAGDIKSIPGGKYKGGTFIPWGFSDSLYASFVAEFEGLTTWKSSGEAELILTNPDMSFRECIVYDIDKMVTEGAVDSPGRLFETIIHYACGDRSIYSIKDMSDEEGYRLCGEGMAQAILKLIPNVLENSWKRGRHYSVCNLSNPRKGGKEKDGEMRP